MDDYYSIIVRAVSRLPSKTDEARYGIYERARTALQETLRNYNLPPSETEIAKCAGCARRGDWQSGSRLLNGRNEARQKRRGGAFSSRLGSRSSELKLYLKSKRVRTLDSGQA